MRPTKNSIPNDQSLVEPRLESGPFRALAITQPYLCFSPDGIKGHYRSMLRCSYQMQATLIVEPSSKVMSLVFASGADETLRRWVDEVLKETVTAVLASLVEEERFQASKLSLPCHVTSSATLGLHQQQGPQHLGLLTLDLAASKL